MANYECVIRTNYFHVKDEDQFQALMDVVSADSLEFWEKKDENGSPVFAFGSIGPVYGIPHLIEGGESEADEESYDELLYQLKDLVAEGEAVIIMEAGHEKLRYVSGNATIVTSETVDYVNLERAALKLARELLGASDYTPEMCY